jgi:hypothetical protein
MKKTKPTIYFNTKLCQDKSGVYIVFPKSAKLSTEEKVEGVINGFPFRCDVKESKLKLASAMFNASKAEVGEEVSIEITFVGEEEETRVPVELSNLLKTNAKAESVWNETTSIARGDWVLWIASSKKADTRLSRIEKAISMLSSGKKRICCFGGRNWLIKTG